MDFAFVPGVFGSTRDNILKQTARKGASLLHNRVLRQTWRLIKYDLSESVLVAVGDNPWISSA